MSPGFCPPAPGKFSQLVQPPVEDPQVPSGPRHSAREEKELGWWGQKEEQRATEASLNSGCCGAGGHSGYATMPRVVTGECSGIQTTQQIKSTCRSGQKHTRVIISYFLQGFIIS